MDADALLRPRGPLPSGVYWRRRLVTLLGVAVVLILVFRACTGGAGTPKAARSPSPTPSHTPSHAASHSPSATPSVTPSGAVAPCRDADLVVSAKADKQAYAAGERPVLTIGIANRGSAPCTRDVGQAARGIVVTSGNDRVWSSDDCSPGGAAQVVTLRPGAAPLTFPVRWARRRSAPGCPSGLRDVTAGTYRVVGHFGTLTSDPDTFSLR